MRLSTTRDARDLCDAVAVDHTVSTAEAAALLGLAPQTLRRWACYGSGPLRPRNLNGRLRWCVADIRRVLSDASSAGRMP